MGTKVEIQTTANAAGALQAFDKVIRKQQTMISQLKATARESKRAAAATGQMGRSLASMSSSAQSVVTSIKASIAGYASMALAIAAVTKEMRNQRDLAREAARE